MAEDTGYLSAEDILGADDRQVMELYVPEWNGRIRLRAMSGNDLIKFQNDIKGPGKDEAFQRSFVTSAVKADGSPLFTVKDIPKLREKSVAAFMRVQKEILKLNGMDEESSKRLVEEAKNV